MESKKQIRYILIVVFAVIFCPLSGPAAAEAPDTTTPKTPEATLQPPQNAKHMAVVIPCEDMIDDGLYQSILRRSEEAIAMGATHIIFEIDTLGGLVKAADDISTYFILELGKQVHTVAYVTEKAISAGAMISVSCKDIIMRANTKIGDCAPITMGGTLEGVEREKIESYIRAIFATAAEANGYPEALLKAMVTQQLEIFRVKNLNSDKYEFFETKDLPKDPNQYDIKNKELIVKDDEILTLTASKAHEYGIARAVVDNRTEAIAFLAKREGITFADHVPVLKTLWSEQLVRWINSPAVMAVLVMLAMLGVYIELNTPGLGLPGLVAVICIIIIIGSKYLVGMANWVEVAIFIIGIILLAVEVLVIPGFGITGFLGIIFIFGGLFGMLIRNPPGEVPWPKTEFAWDIFLDGLVGLSFGFVGFLCLAYIFAKYLPRMYFLRGLMLQPAAAGEQLPPSITTTAPKSAGIKINVGDIGEVVSPLRPAGQARFAQATVDVVTVGEFLENGTKVRIMQIHGNRIVVRETK
ncbi:MAG: NfeD family protein [Dehalococcoidales bacterium]